MDLKEVVSHSLVSKTKGFLEQPSNTSLLQSAFCMWLMSVTLSKAQFAECN
jgi:hypothetical protein